VHVREFRVLIADDEPVARAGIRKLIEADPQMSVVGEAGSGRAAVAAIREHRPDVLFLDVQMPGMSGFEVLAATGSDAVPAVVFVTAWDSFAIRAFEVQALDYVLKPFDDNRFAAVVARAKRHVELHHERGLADRLEALLDRWERGSEATRGSPTAATSPAARPARAGSATSGGHSSQPGRSSPGSLTRITVRGAGQVFFQRADEIDWIEAADYCVRLHVGGKTHVVRETLTRLEEQLDPGLFVRIHRSAIVNVSRVRSIRLDWRNHHEILLRDGTVLPLSRGRAKAVEEVLSGSR